MTDWTLLPVGDALRFDPVKRFALTPDPEISSLAVKALGSMYRTEFSPAERDKFRRELLSLAESPRSSSAIFKFLQDARKCFRKRHADEILKLLLECYHVGNLFDIISDSSSCEDSIAADFTVVSRLVSVQSRYSLTPMRVDVEADWQIEKKLIDSDCFVVASEIRNSSKDELIASLQVCGEVESVQVAGNYGLVKFKDTESAAKLTCLSARLFGVLIGKNHSIFPIPSQSLTVLRVSDIPWRIQMSDLTENFNRIFRGERNVPSVGSSRGLLPDHRGIVEFHFPSVDHLWVAYCRVLATGGLLGEKAPVLSLRRNSE